jgi:uncharacterized membrane protein
METQEGERFNVGAWKQEKADETRGLIRERLIERPGITQTEIARDLGVTKATVSRHVQAIRLEWRGKAQA